MNTTQNYQDKSRTNVIRFLFILALGFLLTVLLSAFRQPTSQVFQIDDGEKVFNLVCKTCHQLEPPASMEEGKMIAPPMKMILSRYNAAFTSTEELKSALNEWLIKPDTARSQMPAHAIEEHGLMPPLTITDAERNAVVIYLMTLVPEGGMDHMNGMMKGKMGEMKGKMGEMKGGMKGKMGQPDSTKHQHKKQN